MDEVRHGAALELRDAVKRYGEMFAVDRISLDIEAGEFMTLLGPSGSGKTTTLNLIAGFAELDGGTIRMDGEPLDHLPAHKRGLGVVFQDYALFPHMTAWENIAFPLKQRKVGKAESLKMVARALELVGLGDLGDRYPRELSGGQKQRIALARAIVFEPKVLLMDEPLGALDKKLRETLQLEIKRIHRDVGITFVFVTHDQEEALALSDRVAVFNEGKIVQVGSAEDLYEDPRSRFVAEFVGDSNIFDGRFASDGDRSVFIAGDLNIITPKIESASIRDSAAVLVRPERLRILTMDEGTEPGLVNEVSATVRQLMYLGSSRRVEAELPGGTMISVREPASAASKIKLGDQVRIVWRAEHSVVLPGH